MPSRDAVAVDGAARDVLKRGGGCEPAAQCGARYAATSLRAGIDAGMLVQSVVALVGGGRLEVERDLLDRAGEGLRCLRVIVQVDNESVVATHVHAGVCRERDRHRRQGDALGR
jgi:hypothetical protein